MDVASACCLRCAAPLTPGRHKGAASACGRCGSNKSSFADRNPFELGEDGENEEGAAQEEGHKSKEGKNKREEGEPAAASTCKARSAEGAQSWSAANDALREEAMEREATARVLLASLARHRGGWVDFDRLCERALSEYYAALCIFEALPCAEGTVRCLCEMGHLKMRQAKRRAQRRQYATLFDKFYVVAIDCVRRALRMADGELALSLHVGDTAAESRFALLGQTVHMVLESGRGIREYLDHERERVRARLATLMERRERARKRRALQLQQQPQSQPQQQQQQQRPKRSGPSQATLERLSLEQHLAELDLLLSQIGALDLEDLARAESRARRVA